MTIKADINKLTVKDEPVSELDEQVPAQTIGSAIGTANFNSGSGSGSTDGDGIDSPLTEQSRTESEVLVFDDFNVWSFKLKAATQIVMTDDSDREVIFNYAEPI